MTAKWIAIWSVIAICVTLVVLLALGGEFAKPGATASSLALASRNFNMLGQRIDPFVLSHQTLFYGLRAAFMLATYAFLMLGRCRGCLFGIISFALLISIAIFTTGFSHQELSDGLDAVLGIPMAVVANVIFVAILLGVGKVIELVSRQALKNR